MKRSGYLIAGVLLLAACAREPAVNPDPNHTHIDFAIWVNGERLDFSDDEYMSESETEESGDDHEEHGHKHHPYLHLHDGNGNVLHRHKPRLALGEFFESLRIGFSGTTPFRMFVNGKEQPFDLTYVFEDLDSILLTNAETDEEVQRQLDAMTNDACLYSRTCPWRGDPPTENCLADPEVPCVVPS